MRFYIYICTGVAPVKPDSLASWFIIRVSAPDEGQHGRERSSGKVGKRCRGGSHRCYRNPLWLDEMEKVSPWHAVANPVNDKGCDAPRGTDGHRRTAPIKKIVACFTAVAIPTTEHSRRLAGSGYAPQQYQVPNVRNASEDETRYHGSLRQRCQQR